MRFLTQLFILSILCLNFVFINSNNENDDDAQTQEDPTDSYRRIFQSIHSLSKPYLGQGMKIPHWMFGGDTMVTKQQIRLTSDDPSLKGYLWNTVPNYSANWEVEIEFKVHGRQSRLYGDGFVFWYTKDYAVEGPVFGSKDFFSGLAVFFDTYSNHQGEHNHGHPYVSAMISDGSQGYDHDADGTHTELAGCQASFRGRDAVTKAKISYIDQILKIQLDYRGYDTFVPCISEKEVYLPTGYHFGFSAITGGLSDNHDIIKVDMQHVASNVVQKNNDYRHIKPGTQRKIADREHVDPVAPSWIGHQLWHVVQILFYLGIVAAIGLGVLFVVKTKLKERDMKRF